METPTIYREIPKQLIIIGGGASLQEGIKKDLWKRLAGKWTIGCNYIYKYYTSTILSYVDKDFYIKQSPEFKHYNLVIGKRHKIPLLPNTIALNTTPKYKRDLTTGIYKANLVGLFALSLGIYLLDKGEIYLLGFDFGELRKKDYTKFAKSKAYLKDISYQDKKGRPLTHFYQGKMEHRGVGKISYYNSENRAKNDFGVYADEKKVKIYNVSLQSKITTFPKIPYDEFLKRLDNKQYCQSYIRTYIKDRIREIYNA